MEESRLCRTAIVIAEVIPERLSTAGLWEDVQKMLLKIAAVALALQVVAPDLLLRESSASAQEVRYRRQADRYFPLEYGGGRRPVPCGHGADIDIRDGLCYPNGAVPRRWQQANRRWVRRGGYYVLE